MPWCTACRRYLAAPTVRPDGSCPKCGTAVETPQWFRKRGRVAWHVALLALVFGIYLAFRLVQGVTWLVHQV